MLYFDHAATTPPDPSVLQTYQQVAQRYFANPSSAHPLGQEARALLDQARSQVAQLLAFDNEEIYFTSSATESNNWVFQSLLDKQVALQPNKRKVLISATEHPSVLQQLPSLEARGYQVLLIKVKANGQLDIEDLQAQLDDQVLLVSTMLVNNEVGAILPIDQVAQLLSSYPQILWHVDAVQAVTACLHLIDCQRIDLLSLSSHKFHSVRGVGVLGIRQRVAKQPLLCGGGQEAGMRSSTENLPAIVASAKALRLAAQAQEISRQDLTSYRQQICQCLQAQGWTIFGGNEYELSPHLVCASLPGIPGEVLLNAFAKEGVMVSTSSACSSRKKNQLHTLQAMGIKHELAKSAIRISLSQKTTAEEVAELITIIGRISLQFIHRK